jgi:hypothetical protein
VYWHEPLMSRYYSSFVLGHVKFDSHCHLLEKN